MSPIITGVRFKMFTSNGTFVVPEGVTKIYVTGCGGGAAGGTSNSSANGGATSLGSIVSLSGGTFITISSARDGKSGPFGGGGIAISGQQSANGYGAGGGDTTATAIGGNGSWVIKSEYTVTPGTSHAVTIGAAGTGGAGFVGSQGFLLVEW